MDLSVSTLYIRYIYSLTSNVNVSDVISFEGDCECLLSSHLKHHRGYNAIDHEIEAPLSLKQKEIL